MQAQKGDYAKGFIVSNQGDTSQGLIEWKKNFKCNEPIYFKGNSTDLPSPINLKEVSSFYNSESKKQLVVVKVKVKWEYVDPIELNVINNDSISTAFLPLKPLHLGDSLSLLSYHDKTDFFFLVHGDYIEQLVREYEFLTDHERLVHSNRILPAYKSYDTWKVQLYNYYNFNSDKKMYNLSLDATFDEYNLTKLVSRMDRYLCYPKIK